MMDRTARLISIGFSVVLLAVAGSLAFYVSAPPYEAQVRLFMLLHKKDVRALAEQFSRDKDFDGLYIGFKPGHVRIRRRRSNAMEEQLPPKAAAIYWKLMVAAHMQMAIKPNGGVLFVLGSLWKFDKQFDVGIFYHPGLYDRRPCNGQYVGTIFGACEIPLGGPWYIDYQWENIQEMMKIEKLHKQQKH